MSLAKHFEITLRRAFSTGGLIVLGIILAIPSVAYAQTEILYHGQFPGNDIFTSENDGSNLQSINTSGSGTLDVEVDLANGFIYWSVFNTNQIFRANLDGTNANVIHNTAGNPYGIAIDTVNDRIFAGHWINEDIRCGALGGNGAFNVLVNAPNNVADVEYDPVNNALFYAVAIGTAAETGIYRVPLGNGCSTAGPAVRIVADVARPYGIALDIANDLLYWTNPIESRVARSSLSGAGTILNFCSGGNPAGVWLTGIDLLNGELYWNSFSEDRTYRSPAAACNITTLNTGTIDGPWGMAAVEFNPAVEVEKFTNGSNSDSAPGNNIVQGSQVTWTYEVSNNGNTVLNNLSLSDNVEGTITNRISGDTDNDGLLDPGETHVFQATGSAVLGQYSNTATVTASSSVNPAISDSDTDSSHYFGISPDTQAPLLQNFSSTSPDGTYGPGATINITATYNEALANGSSLTLQLDNGQVVSLNTVSGNSVSGNYTVGTTGSGQDSLDLTVTAISSESVTDLNSNTQTTSTTPAAPSNLGDSSNIVVDVTAPSLATVTTVPSPTLNSNPSFVYSSNEAGTTSFSGDCDSQNTTAISGNNTAILDSNGSGLALSDGTYSNCTLSVTDAVGNVSNSLAINSFTVDTAAPQLLSFNSSSADGTYGPGSNLNITAVYNEDLAPGSSISVLLNNGVSLTLSSISFNELSGTYSVGITGSGQDTNDLSVSSISSESVSDSLGNSASSSSLPTSPNNIADVSAIIIDVTAPSLSEVTPVTPTPTSNRNPSYSFSSDETGTATYGGDCNSSTTVANNGTNSITFDSNGSGGQLADGVYSNCTITATDAVGNVSSALAVSTFEIETNPPSLVSFTSSTANDTYGPGSTINVTATYNEPLGAGANLTVTLDNGASVSLNNVSGSTVSGAYTVGATGSSEDTADLNVSSITSENVGDALGNNQTSSPLPGAPNNIADSSDIVIDVTAPLLNEITPVPTPGSNQNPSYTYSSDEAGNTNFSGGCESTTGTTAVGNNTLVLDSDGAGAPLAPGTFSSCQITVTDAVGNSASLPISTFVIAQSSPGGVSSGLELWFKADEEAFNTNGGPLANNGQTVQRWNDQSGNDFDALQNNSGRRPVFTTTTGTTNNFNPTLFFDGENPNEANRDRLPILGKFYDQFSSLDQVYIYVAYRNTNQDANWAFLDFDRSEWYNASVDTNGDLDFHYRGDTAIRDNEAEATADSRNGLAHIISYAYDNSLTNETVIRFDSQERLADDREPTGTPLEDSTTRFGFIGDGSEADSFDGNTNNVFYEGDISEIILFENNSFSVGQQRQIESYLALKYGVTPDGSLGFLSDSAGNSVFDLDDGLNGGTASDGTADWQDVAGIAYDSIGTLNQRVSKSVNTSSVLTIATDNDFLSLNDASRTALVDGHYLVWGHDGGDNVATQVSDIDLSLYSARIEREWKFENTNLTEDIFLNFDALPPLPSGSEYILLADADGDFTAGSIELATSTGTSFSNVSIPNGVNFLTVAISGIPVAIEFDRDLDSDLEAIGGNIPQLLILGEVFSNTPITVLVSSPDALNGTDYTIATTTIAVGSYDGTASTAIPINLSIIDDGNAELLETLTLTIQAPTSPSINIGDANGDSNTQSSSSYDIIDDDIGPGGVADRVLFWYRGDIGTSTTADNTALQTWFDQLAPAVDASQTAVGQQPLFLDNPTDEINFNPEVSFDGIDDQLELPDQNFVNLSQTPFKALHLVVETGADINTSQLIYEEGGQIRGFNAYIQNGLINFSAWNFQNDGVGAPWDHSTCSIPVATNTAYLATVNLRGNSSITGSIDCWLEGEASTSPGSNIGILYPHSGDTALGTIDEVTIFDDGTASGNRVDNEASYEGDISEAIYYDDFDQDPVSRNRVESYLAIKYGFTLHQDAGGIDYVNSVNQVLFAATSTHLGYNNDIAGISIDSATILNQPLSQSINDDRLFTIGNATDHDDREALLWGNNDGATNTWSPIASQLPLERITREWRFDEMGDVGEVFAEIDATNLPTLSPNYGYAVCVDADGDFSSGTDFFPLTNTSGNLWSGNGIEPGGDSFFTICQYPVIPPEVILSINPTSVTEGGSATITATATYAWFSPITVNLATSGDAEPTDFSAPASITIPVGSQSSSALISTNNDTVDEPTETVLVDISTVTNGTEQGTQQVSLAIQDNDAPPAVTLSKDNEPIAENGGTSTFTATLSAASELVVTVDLGFSGTATLNTDYTSSANNISIPAGSTTGAVVVTAADDPNDEPNETVVVEITTVSNATEQGSQSAQTTITDDDNPPSVSLNVDLSSIPENGGVATVTASLDNTSAFPVTVNLLLTGSATLGGDYNTSGTTITIPAGSSSGTITLTAVDDPNDDDGETIVVDINTVNNGTENGVQQVVVTILDDDATCNENPWLAPTGTNAMVALSADGIFNPGDPNFLPPSGNDFDTTILGRTPADADARRALAFDFFLNTYGVDFNAGTQLDASNWISADSKILLVYAMTDPRYDYKLNAISDVRIAPVNGEVFEAAYLMVVIDPAGATLFGTYGGAAGVPVPRGTGALHGELFMTVPVLCNDNSIDWQVMNVMYQSIEPVLANTQDKVIYNDEVIANDRFSGNGFAFSRKGIRFLRDSGDYQAIVTNIITFYP